MRAGYLKKPYEFQVGEEAERGYGDSERDRVGEGLNQTACTEYFHFR